MLECQYSYSTLVLHFVHGKVTRFSCTWASNFIVLPGGSHMLYMYIHAEKFRPPQLLEEGRFANWHLATM